MKWSREQTNLRQAAEVHGAATRSAEAGSWAADDDGDDDSEDDDVDSEVVKMMMLVGDGEHSQRERVRVVNVDVVMPTCHVTDHVLRLGDRHRDGFNCQQSPCVRTSHRLRRDTGVSRRPLRHCL